MHEALIWIFHFDCWFFTNLGSSKFNLFVVLIFYWILFGEKKFNKSFLCFLAFFEFYGKLFFCEHQHNEKLLWIFFFIIKLNFMIPLLNRSSFQVFSFSLHLIFGTRFLLKFAVSIKILENFYFLALVQLFSYWFKNFTRSAATKRKRKIHLATN